MKRYLAVALRAGTLFLVAALGLDPVIRAQSPKTEPSSKFALTIDNIMRGPELVGYEPRAVRWSGDSKRVYFQWKQVGDPRDREFDTYVVNRDGSGLKKLTEDEARIAPPASGDQSDDKKLTVFSDAGDIFLFDHAKGERRELMKTADAESNPRFTQDQRHVYFTRSNNLFMMSLDSGSLVQMTDIRAAGAPPPQQPAAGGGFRRGQAQTRQDAAQQRGTESQEQLKKEERELIEFVRRRAEQREEAAARRNRENPRKPFNLQSRQSIASLQLSPDQKYVIAVVSEAGDGAKNTVVPNYITEAAYTEDIPSRTKVGDSQNRTRLAILSADTGAITWVDHGQKTVEGDEAEKSDATAQGDVRQGRERSGRPDRDVQLSSPIWSDDGARAVVTARAADNKDRWIMALDPETGKMRVLAAIHDDAWVDGPGAFTVGWMGDNQHVYFQSERDGYSHLYTVSYDGGEPKQLTSGRWEVTGVQLSRDKSRFFLTTSEVDPGERHFYRMPASGGDRVRITSKAGNNQVAVSPDEQALAIIHSYSNEPPELYIQENGPDAVPVKVTSSPSSEFRTYDWIDPPIITFAARDGAAVRARLYKPKNFRRGGPAVIFVHGAGYAQNVHRWWSSYYREYMFHHLLMEHGYVALDVDYRASAGYGRDWRTAIYRHMGGTDLDDQVDAARWLVREHGVDAKRIGIYGGSYGGFITLMAMFTQPDVFAAGASLRPVTDWAHYNHGYTSNILNVPQKDTEAYKRSSPIFFAERLKGALLICHGMVDTNVHFQDTVRLVQRLIELRKENWELAVYPVENHGFVEPTSWADEYKRIFKLFETNLKK